MVLCVDLYPPAIILELSRYQRDVYPPQRPKSFVIKVNELVGEQFTNSIKEEGDRMKFSTAPLTVSYCKNILFLNIILELLRLSESSIS